MTMFKPLSGKVLTANKDKMAETAKNLLEEMVDNEAERAEKERREAAMRRFDAAEKERAERYARIKARIEGLNAADSWQDTQGKWWEKPATPEELKRLDDRLSQCFSKPSKTLESEFKPVWK